MPGDVQWTATRYKLRLRVKLDWGKYKAGGLILPPDIGRCKSWRFEIAADQKSAVFSGMWEKRMLRSDVDREELTAKIQTYALSII